MSAAVPDHCLLGREGLLELLAELGLQVRTFDHAAVFTVEEAARECKQIDGLHCKNLFLKDKAGSLFLVTCAAERAIRLDAALVGLIGASKSLRFASEETLGAVLGLTKGSVTPFGLCNDRAHSVRLILDAALAAEPTQMLCFHPMINTATTQISFADLVTFLRAVGAVYALVDLGSVQ